MKAILSKNAEKAYLKLSPPLRKKLDKQLAFLEKDIKHPSLRIKKMQGVDRWEARIDRSYRFTFDKGKDYFYIRTLGPHDEGLGKK